MEFEGDSETLMKIMRGTLDIPRTYVGNIVFGIKCRLSLFEMATFSHTGRLSNKLAHVLSQHAYVEPDRIWIEDLPTAAMSQLVSDLNN